MLFACMGEGLVVNLLVLIASKRLTSSCLTFCLLII